MADVRYRVVADPTEEEIAEMCEAIQAEWSEAERLQRRLGGHGEAPTAADLRSAYYTIPTVKTPRQ